jgi:hypothetical protein
MSKPYNDLYVEQELIKSPAYIELGGKAPQVFMLFLCRRRVEKESRGRHVITNNGKIIFPYKEALEKYGIKKSTFAKALDKLVENGFIDVSHSGGGMNGDCSLFAISDRWRKFGTKKFVSKVRKKRNSYGFTTKNWEERTGRKKKKRSLENHTGLSLENHIGGSEIHTGREIGEIDINFFIRKGKEVLSAFYFSNSNLYGKSDCSIESINSSVYSTGYHPLK